MKAKIKVIKVKKAREALNQMETQIHVIQLTYLNKESLNQHPHTTHSYNYEQI